MASSSGKPTAVHFSLIFFVMTTIIAGVVAYLMYRQYDELAARTATESENLRKQTEVARNRDDDVQKFKTRSGHQFADVGNEDTANTVIWALANDIRTYGGYPPATPAAQLPTVHDAFIEMRRQIDQLQSDYNRAMADVQGRDETIADLRDVYQKMVDEANTGRKAAEDVRTAVQASADERMQAAEAKFNEVQAELAAVRAELVQTTEEKDKQIALLQKETKDLITINERIKEKLDGVQQYSFEVADGEIRWVDHTSRLVWINVGSADNLSKGTTFSVYSKGHSGIGRGTEDIKGAIEVTMIKGPHLAEARLIDNDIYRPMAPGDPIYTPLWSPGRTETFAIVGFIDVDGDGKSDRALLNEFVATTGARFSVQIDDEGNRLPDENATITEQTKFFVVADLPDPSTTSDANEKKLYGQILAEHSKLEKEARQQGVRKVSLGDFLAYIGYKHQRRLWRPGDGTPYTLKSGSQSTTVDEVFNQRESSASGQTSGLYSRSKRLKPETSSGQTSKVFRGGSYGK
jgi:hypothetical protein